MIEQLAICLFARGHALLMGVPGLAKTLLVSSVAQTFDLSFNRIQFTPDLMPADITGTDIIQESGVGGRREFQFIKGPVFANIVLADEINRAPAKVQSALLEAMQERQVTLGDRSYPLPKPFLVMATQNPIENEGVYPLPEAQRDRFLFKINVDYPSPEEEREIIYRMGVTPPEPKQVLETGDLLRLQDVAANNFVHHALVDYVVRVVTATRRPVVALIATGDELVMPGESPRADQIIASNAFALKAMVEAEGAEARLLPIARDTVADLTTVLGLAVLSALVVLDDSAKELLVAEGYDPQYGARPMRRAVEKHLEDPFAEHLLRGDIKEGDTVRISLREGEKTLKFSVDEPPAPPVPPTSMPTCFTIRRGPSVPSQPRSKCELLHGA